MKVWTVFRFFFEYYIVVEYMKTMYIFMYTRYGVCGVPFTCMEPRFSGVACAPPKFYSASKFGIYIHVEGAESRELPVPVAEVNNTETHCSPFFFESFWRPLTFAHHKYPTSQTFLPTCLPWWGTWRSTCLWRRPRPQCGSAIQ